MQDILLYTQKHPLLVAVFLIVLITLTILEFIKSKKATTALTPAQVTNYINHQNAKLIDIRPADHFATGHIIGAVSLPFSGFSDKLKKIESHKNQPIVLVCATGMDSPKAMDVLQKNGFSQVFYLSGGLKAWKDAELPLAKG